MTSFLSRDGREALGSIAIMGCAALIAFASALFFLGLPLFMWFAFGDTGSSDGRWVAWLLGTLFVLFFNIARAVDIFRNQNPRDLARMLLVTLLVILACPLTAGALFA